MRLCCNDTEPVIARPLGRGNPQALDCFATLAMTGCRHREERSDPGAVAIAITVTGRRPPSSPSGRSALGRCCCARRRGCGRFGRPGCRCGSSRHPTWQGAAVKAQVGRSALACRQWWWRHCERSEAIQGLWIATSRHGASASRLKAAPRNDGPTPSLRLPRRFAPRNDRSVAIAIAVTGRTPPSSSAGRSALGRCSVR